MVEEGEATIMVEGGLAIMEGVGLATIIMAEASAITVAATGVAHGGGGGDIGGGVLLTM